MPWQLEDTHGVTETLFRPLTDEERMEQSRTVPEADISLDLEQLVSCFARFLDCGHSMNDHEHCHPSLVHFVTTEENGTSRRMPRVR